MNEKDTCSIVQDLLPSHIEHLTKDFTNQFIIKHIEECEDCKQVLKAMEVEPPRKRASAIREINYLFKVKRTLILKFVVAFMLVIAISSIVYGIFIRDFSLPPSEITITDVYRLSNGKICYGINYSKPYTIITRYPNWTKNKEGLGVEYSFLGYNSLWEYWITPKPVSVLHDVIELGEDYVKEGKYITAPQSAFYYGDPRSSHTPLLIWQEGMEIEDAPAEIEKMMRDRYYIDSESDTVE